MESEKREKIVIIDFNPSARNSTGLDQVELDYVREAIKKAGMAFAKKADEDLMIFLMGIIRKRLREDSTFAEKLRDLLGLKLERNRKSLMEKAKQPMPKPRYKGRGDL